MNKKATSDLMTSSLSEDWPTNQEWFNEWNAEFGFTLDAASNPVNAKCKKHYTMQENGLLQNWSNERVFINPPYNDLYAWVEKAAKELYQHKVFTVMFLPARTQNNFFHDFVWNSNTHTFHRGIQVRFLKRLQFADSAGPCPFGLMLLIFNPELL